MKKLLILLALLPLLMNCSSDGGMAEKNIALIEKYVAAVENLDYETMEVLLADNYVGLGPSYGDSIRKTEAIEQWKRNIENLYEKIDYNRSRNFPIKVTTGDNQGDWVSSWAELNIHYKNGRGPALIWANSIYQIENNQIVKSYTFYNEADVLEQLGYVFVHPDDL